MAAITFSDSPVTDVGSGLGHFQAALQYTPISATQGTLSIQVSNITDPGRRGYIVAFAFGNPGGLITGISPTYNNTGMGQIGAPGYSRGFDCANALTGWGSYDIGMSVGSDWNNAGYQLVPRAGIRNGQSGVFSFNLAGTSMDTLSEASFQAAKSSGATPRFFTVNFQLLNDEQSSSGYDMVAAG